METDAMDKKPKTLTITIDGEEFEVEGRDHSARELLQLAGLDPGTTYLIELRGHEQIPHRDNPDESIKLHNQMRFVSADIGSAPVA
jgi:Multiubiquitin